MACFSSNRCTGMESFPRKRLMIGRLFANLSFTSISRTSVGRETKLNSWKRNNTQREKITDVFPTFPTKYLDMYLIIHHFSKPKVK